MKNRIQKTGSQRVSGKFKWLLKDIYFNNMFKEVNMVVIDQY